MIHKKIMAILLTAICFCMSFSVSASAETSTSILANDVAPAYEIAYNVTSSLSISGNTAYCTSKSDGINAVSITVEQTLEKYSGWFAIWNAVDGASWTKTVNKKTISVSNTKGGLSSGTYRLKSVFTLTRSDGETETITIYSSEKTVN